MKYLIFLFPLFLLSCSSTSSSDKVEKWGEIIEEATKPNRKYKYFDNSDLKIGDSIGAKVIKILDGDTYDALVEEDSTKTTIRIRMLGIDAPEGGMPYYRKAKNYLADLCAGQFVGIKISDIDHYDRGVAYTYLEDGRELSHEMVKAGFAWHYIQYSDDVSLSKLEEEARKEKRGIWKDNDPIPPWEIRKLERQGISTKEIFKND